MKHEQEPTIGGLRYRNPVFHKSIELATRLVVKDRELKGKEHLEYLRERLRKGDNAFIASNHLSMFDANAIDFLLDTNGYRDIAEKIVNIYGIKIDENWRTRALSRAFSIIPVWPPSKVPQTEDEKKYKNELNSASEQGVEKALTNGDVIVIFPEATRSRSGELAEAKPATEPIFEMGTNTLVVPVALQGTNTIWPVDGRLHRGSISMSVGMPIEMSQLAEKYQHLKYKPRRVAIMNEIMKPIAQMLPEEQRGFYTEIIREQQEMLRSVSD